MFETMFLWLLFRAGRTYKHLTWIISTTKSWAGKRDSEWKVWRCLMNMRNGTWSVPTILCCVHTKDRCHLCWGTFQWQKVRACQASFWFRKTESLLVLHSGKMIHIVHSGSTGELSVSSVLNETVWPVSVEETQIYTRDPGKTTLSSLATTAISRVNIRARTQNTIVES